MKQISLALNRGVLYAAILLASFLVVGSAEATTTNSPSNSQWATTSSCTKPSIQGFTAYIYEGELNSFEYTVVGCDHPLVSATVAGRVIENRYATFKSVQAGITRVHVDVPSWYGFSGDTSIVIAALTGPKIDCFAQSEFHVKLAEYVSQDSIAQVVEPPVMPVVEMINPISKTPEPPTKVGIIEGGSTDVVAEDGTQKEDQKSDNEGLTRKMVASISAFLGSNVEKGTCKTMPTSGWIALAIICVVAILIVVDRLPYLLSGNGVKFAVVLLIIFLVMLGLWFIFDQCRSQRWFPIVVTLLTLGTLITPTALDTKKMGRGK